MQRDKNGWISISEALPDDCQECFVWFKNEIRDSWCYTKYINESFDHVIGVTHWRPVFKGPIKKRNKACQP